MTKKKYCMDNQIDLLFYERYVMDQQKKELKKMISKTGSIPFCYLIFREAYRKVKKNGMIVRTDILEQKTTVEYEVYESVYINTLRVVYLKCCKEVKDEKMRPILTDMYEKEFEWMAKRFFLQRVDTE